jgi:hypothetical protein
MKAEDHIRFVSNLLEVIDELQALVRDHCRDMTQEEKPYWVVEKENRENVPF